MAKLICILGYVIAIISVLSNAQIISINKNNQYADHDVQVDAAAYNATTTTTTSTSTTTTTTSSSTSIASKLNATTTPPPTTMAIDTGPPFINATAAAASEPAATVADAETSGGRRSRYEEFDLDEPLPTDDDANDDASFEELTLDTDPDVTSTVRPVVTASTRQPFISTQNIYKITKSTKSKSLKRSSSGTAPVLAQPLLEIRLSKPTSKTFGTEKQFNDVNAFRYITELFDQYQWNADDVRDDISSRCASDLDTFIHALVDGKAWATKASDASGRYRGQFLFGNDLWVGSLVICNELGNIDEMDLSFYIATVSLTSTEPLMKRHVLQVGQCLPQVCSGTDVRTILNADAAVIKFNEMYVNATETGVRKNGIRVINVRRVPGEYAITRDPAFYLTLCICVVVGALVVIATAYERSLQVCHGKRSHSLPTVHPIQMHNKQIMSFEQTNITDEDTDSMKLNKIHASNILNGCTFELHPISIENDSNGTQSPPKPPPMPPSLPGSPLSSAILLEKNNQKNNQNGDDLYHLSHTNGTQPSNGNSNGNSKHHQNGSSHNNNNCNNNKNPHQHHQSNVVTHRKNSDTRNGEIVEKVNTKRLSTPQRLLLSFGLSTNIKTILSSKKLPQDSVSCIHGMRVFSMLWTIMVHTYLQTFGISENRFSKTITERTFLYQIIGNATYGVDTFFFLSGLLVTLLFLRTKESTKHPSDVSLASGTKQSLLLFIYRYVRLTPVYFVVIIINMVSLKYIYNGSVFPPGLPDHIVCPNYWWRNILYIQTWFPFHQLCMLWSWYLADDMQFYIWAIVLLIFAKRHAKAAVTIIVTFLLTSWIVSAMVSLKFNYSLKVSEPLESFGFLYEKPWTRLGPYVMGMAAGYILNRFKSPPKVSPFINLILWAMSLCIMFLLVFGVWNGTLNPTWTAIYVSLGHTAWGFALIWITLSCKWGYAKPINDLLSYRPMLPLSRLTYCAYLIHPVTQIVMSFQLKGPVHIQHALVLTIFMGNAIISYTCALVLSLMFEAPVVRMLKILFGR